MEAAGLAIGVVGLVALVDSCKRLMGRIESFQHVGLEARPILVEFSANKHLFDRWLQHVKVTEQSIQTTSGEKVDEKTAQVIRDLVSCIEDALKTIEVVISDFRPSGPEGIHGGDQPTLKRRPTGFSTKTKFQWAFSKKEKAIKGIQEFYRLIEKLHAVIPVSGPSGYPKQSQPLAATLPDEFAAHLDKLLERYKAEDRRSITQWLGAKSTESYYEERLRECQDGTCSWIVDRPDFVSWVSSDFPNDSAKLLWLHAPAGFGKTTICAKIVELLKTTTPAATALYFFSGRETDTYAIFRSWISQAAYQNDSIVEIVANNPRLTSTPTATRSDLERVFRSIVESALEFTFVIDGLDECEDSRGHPADFTETNRHQFVIKLRELISGTRTRVMVVSRPFLDIRSAIHLDESEHRLTVFDIPMTEHDVGDDLKAFSKAIVDKKLSNRPDDSRAELANQMAERASGMFLWVKLHQSALRRSKNQNQLREIIMHMPEGLNRTYDKNMERIRSLGRVDRSRAYLILSWIMVGDNPPTVAQIAIGFAVQRSGMSADLQCDELPDIVDQDYINEEIIDTCAGLVEVKVNSQVQSPQHQSIRFVHSSVRDYLTQLIPGNLMDVPLSENDIQRGHLCFLLLRFLTYESAWEPPSSLTTDLQLLPFLDFATLSWLRYFPSAPSEQLWALVNDFFSLKNAKWERWRAEFEVKQVCLALLDMPQVLLEAPIDGSEFRQKAFLGEIRGQPNYPPEASEIEAVDKWMRQRIDTMGLASSELYEFFGKFKPIVEKLFPDLQIFENGLHPPGTLVYYAVHTKHIQLVRAMIENEPKSINTSGGVRGSALQLACRMALPNIVEELINRGANINLQSGAPGNALMAAAHGGSQIIVDMLLRSGANVNVRDSLGLDALMYALHQFHTDVIKQLLQHGAKADVRYNIPTLSGIIVGTALLCTALQNNAEAFELLVEMGADQSAKTDRQENFLHVAAMEGSTEFVDKIMDRAEFDLLNARDSDGFTPLCAAIVRNHAEISCRLISGGAKLDVSSDNGMTPLHWAVDLANLDVVRAILEQGVGVNVNAPDSDGDTPLHLAVDRALPDIVRAILEQGVEVDVNAPNSDGDTPLHLAVDRALPDIVQAILELGLKVDVDARDSNRDTPLHLAALWGEKDICEILLDHGANLDLKCDNGNCPIHEAVDENRIESVNVFLDKDEDMLEARDSNGNSPLSIAANLGFVEMARHLLKRGANVHAKNDNGSTPLLMAAISNKQTEMIDLLVNHDANISTSNNFDLTPIFGAARNGQLENYKTLRRHGADETATDSKGFNVLHHSTQSERTELVQYLLDRGWDPKIVDNKGFTAFHHAARNGFKDILALLLDHGTFKVTLDSRGQSPLHIAVEHGRVECLELFLDRGLTDDIDIRDFDGTTPLATAAFYGHNEVMKLLLSQLPGTINDRTAHGDTPLLLASFFGHIQVMETLIEHGADISALNPDGRTPLQLAVRQGHLHAVKVLLKELHRQMNVSELRPISFSANKLRRSRSLRQIEKRSAISDDEASDDNRSIRSV